MNEELLDLTCFTDEPWFHISAYEGAHRQLPPPRDTQRPRGRPSAARRGYQDKRVYRFRTEKSHATEQDLSTELHKKLLSGFKTGHLHEYNNVPVNGSIYQIYRVGLAALECKISAANRNITAIQDSLEDYARDNDYIVAAKSIVVLPDQITFIVNAVGTVVCHDTLYYTFRESDVTEFTSPKDVTVSETQNVEASAVANVGKKSNTKGKGAQKNQEARFRDEKNKAFAAELITTLFNRLKLERIIPRDVIFHLRELNLKEQLEKGSLSTGDILSPAILTEKVNRIQKAYPNLTIVQEMHRIKRIVPLLILGTYDATRLGAALGGFIWNRVDIGQLQDQVERLEKYQERISIPITSLTTSTNLVIDNQKHIHVAVTELGLKLNEL
ncbi:hypothetical protein CBL_08485 [Carabus blaptoides fortunei]